MGNLKKLEMLSLNEILDPLTYIKGSIKKGSNIQESCSNYQLFTRYSTDCLNLKGNDCQNCKNYKNN